MGSPCQAKRLSTSEPCRAHNFKRRQDDQQTDNKSACEDSKEHSDNLGFVRGLSSYRHSKPIWAPFLSRQPYIGALSPRTLFCMKFNHRTPSNDCLSLRLRHRVLSTRHSGRSPPASRGAKTAKTALRRRQPVRLLVFARWIVPDKVRPPSASFTNCAAWAG